MVNALAQFLAGLEVWHVFGRDGDGCTRFRIAPIAGWTVVESKAAEPAYLRPASISQGARQLIQDRVHGELDVLEGEAWKNLG